MENTIDSIKFKKHLLISYIHSIGNCKKFDNFIRLISTTENECHNLIIDLMKSGFIDYKNDGYEINEELLKGYKYFIFTKDFNFNNELKNTNKNAIMYLPKKFLSKYKK